MPYQLKDKLARRGFWFIFQPDERMPVDEVYTFEARVTLAGQTEPLLTFDSTKHTFWYRPLKLDKNRTGLQATTFSMVSQGAGLAPSELPCIVAFHADLPPDVNVTAEVAITDWKGSCPCAGSKLNVQKLTAVNELRVDFVGVDPGEVDIAFAGARPADEPDTLPDTGLLVDVPLLPPVPIVALFGKGACSSPEQAAPWMGICDWSGARPKIVLNGTSYDAFGVMNGTEVETGSMPLPYLWSGEVRVDYPARPRIEAVADNGAYCGAAFLDYTAQVENNAPAGYKAANAKREDTEPWRSVIHTTYLSDGFDTAGRVDLGEASDGSVYLGSSLPFSLTPRQALKRYSFKLRLLKESHLSLSSTLSEADLDALEVEMKVSCSGHEYDVKLTPKAPDTSTSIQVEFPSSTDPDKQEALTVYVWDLEYTSDVLVCLEDHETLRPAEQWDKRKNVLRAKLGDMLAAVAEADNRYSTGFVSAVLLCKATALGAGFCDPTVDSEVRNQSVRTGFALSAHMHMWYSRPVALAKASSQTPAISAGPPPAAAVEVLGHDIRFEPDGSKHVSESLYVRRYGCEKIHPVRVWRRADRPERYDHPEPMLSLSCRQMWSAFGTPADTARAAAGSARPSGILCDAWFVAEALYYGGHLRGRRLGHPSPDSMVVLFHGWPGVTPRFVQEGIHVEPFGGFEALSVPDHGNLTEGRDVVDVNRRQGAGAAMDAWFAQIGRFDSLVNDNIKRKLTDRATNRQLPRVEIYDSWNPIAPLHALYDIIDHLGRNPDCESVSLGGYSIGTNRALWLARVLQGEFSVYLPRSTTLERIRLPGKRNLRAVSSNPVFGESYVPWEVNRYDVFDLLKRRACVNHLAFMDFNFGSATFLPYTMDFEIPKATAHEEIGSIVRQVHHLFSTGAMTKGKEHYGYKPKLRPWEETLADWLVPGLQALFDFRRSEAELEKELMDRMLDRRGVRFASHRDVLGPGKTPGNVVEHTWNLWKTFETKLMFNGPTHYPEKGLADLDLGELGKVFEDHLPALLEYLRENGYVYRNEAALNRLMERLKNKKTDPSVTIESLASDMVPILKEFLVWLLIYALIGLFADLAAAALGGALQRAYELVKTIVKIVGAIKKVFERLYWMADTQMLLAYSEDGVANSSGKGFIYKSTGLPIEWLFLSFPSGNKWVGTGLIRPGASFSDMPGDHLQMGTDANGAIATRVYEILTGQYGRIR